MDSSSTRTNGDSTSGFNPDDDLKYGFQRPEMYRKLLAGTVEAYDRHVFLCYKSPQNWPASIEEQDSDPLPRLLVSTLKSRKDHTHEKIRLTLCEGGGDTESSSGDILIFPDMIRYRGLTPLEVGNFIDDVFVKSSQWALALPETLTGSYIFVCCHQNRDRRCGHCGPVLVERFKEEIGIRGMKDEVYVSPCSHLGGHQYAGNLIIFGLGLRGNCEGHWYGYVTPSDVPVLLDEHIRKRKIVERLWRGQLGMLDGEGRRIREPKLQNESNWENGLKTSTESSSGGNKGGGGVSCCGAGGVCCGDKMGEENTRSGERDVRGTGTKGLGKM